MAPEATGDAVAVGCDPSLGGGWVGVFKSARKIETSGDAGLDRVGKDYLAPDYCHHHWSRSHGPAACKIGRSMINQANRRRDYEAPGRARPGGFVTNGKIETLPRRRAGWQNTRRFPSDDIDRTAASSPAEQAQEQGTSFRS
jgi:hypothetical protein